jgi:hypothetical protein
MRPFDHHPSFFARPRLQALTNRISQLLGELSQTHESQIELQLNDSRPDPFASPLIEQAKPATLSEESVLRLARSHHSVRSRPVTA